jgi:hypothetical protein
VIAHLDRGSHRCGQHNPDAWGAARALEEAISLAGRHAVVIGADGAARAVAHSLVSEGMRVRVVNRTLARAEALAQSVGASAGELECDVLVNCSSVTMSDVDGKSPFPERKPARKDGGHGRGVQTGPNETSARCGARRCTHGSRRSHALASGAAAARVVHRAVDPIAVLDAALDGKPGVSASVCNFYLGPGSP